MIKSLKWNALFFHLASKIHVGDTQKNHHKQPRTPPPPRWAKLLKCNVVDILFWCFSFINCFGCSNEPSQEIALNNVTDLLKNVHAVRECIDKGSFSKMTSFPLENEYLDLVQFSSLELNSLKNGHGSLLQQ